MIIVADPFITPLTFIKVMNKNISLHTLVPGVAEEKCVCISNSWITSGDFLLLLTATVKYL